MESMTKNYGSRAIPTQLWSALKESSVKDARDCIMSMGITAENVAERYKVSRADQDEFSARSHHKAAKAQKEGLFDDEIVPVTTRWHPDPENAEKEEEITVSKDMAILSLVGRNMRNAIGSAGLMFSSLARAMINIEMISQGASEINISCGKLIATFLPPVSYGYQRVRYPKENK